MKARLPLRATATLAIVFIILLLLACERGQRAPGPEAKSTPSPQRGMKCTKVRKATSSCTKQGDNYYAKADTREYKECEPGGENDSCTAMEKNIGEVTFYTDAACTQRLAGTSTYTITAAECSP